MYLLPEFDKLTNMVKNNSINSIEKKLYQMIIARLSGNLIDDKSYQEKIIFLVKKGIGGFLLFGGKKNNVKKFIKKLQNISEIPLFIASDIEKGVGHQIEGCTIFPSQMAVASSISKNNNNDLDLLDNMLNKIISEALDIGINMPLIPVVDVNQNPDNPIICTRAFSDDPDIVSWFTEKYIKNMEACGLITCAKHFPGHGDTSKDSHITLPVINKSLNELYNIDIKPFKTAIKAGTSSIMVGHLCITSLDKKPASVSKKVIQNLLREKLNFKKLVITDALTMNALKNIEDVEFQCIKAGNDILLHPYDPVYTVSLLVKKIRDNKLTEDRINKSFNKIITIKKKLTNKQIYRVNYRENKKVSTIIYNKSITLVKNRTDLIPFNGKKPVLMTIFGEISLFDSDYFIKRLKILSIIKDPEEITLTNIKDKYEAFICIIFTTISAWKGHSGLLENEIKTIHRLLSKVKNSILISFGNPYIIRYFPNADSIIVSYDVDTNAQKAVIECLIGKSIFEGKLPVKIF